MDASPLDQLIDSIRTSSQFINQGFGNPSISTMTLSQPFDENTIQSTKNIDLNILAFGAAAVEKVACRIISKNISRNRTRYTLTVTLGMAIAVGNGAEERVLFFLTHGVSLSAMRFAYPDGSMRTIRLNRLRLMHNVLWDLNGGFTLSFQSRELAGIFAKKIMAHNFDMSRFRIYVPEGRVCAFSCVGQKCHAMLNYQLSHIVPINF
jgi:hypothetical protein